MSLPIRNGSVIFWQDGIGSRIIKRVTGSNLVHAAIILDGLVYEAVPPRVHKVPLYAYAPKYAWFVLQPITRFPSDAIERMRIYADKQLGRKYQLRAWWKGKETRGLFCSQYIGNILEQGGIITSSGWGESPGSLYDKLIKIYQ